jgi:hypothetical protein
MKIKDSIRLYYGKYTRKVVFHATSVSKIKAWLELGDCEYIVRKYRTNKTVVVFLSDEAKFNAISLAFASDLKEQYKPATDAIACYIQNNAQVEVRKQLFSQKYRHRIYFQYKWSEKGSPALVEFVKQHLSNRDDYRYNVDWNATFYSYLPCLYLAHDSDLMMLKMSACPTAIYKITSITLPHEI